MITTLLLSLLLDAPVLTSARQTDNGKQVELKWTHPDAYEFEIRTVSGPLAKLTSHGFMGARARGIHTFTIKRQLVGATNVITIRAIDGATSSRWSNPIVVITAR